jgi:hypothetical protein
MLPEPAPVTIALFPFTLNDAECSVSFFRPGCLAAMMV